MFAIVKLAELLAKADTPLESLRAACLATIREMAPEEMPRLARLLIDFPLGETVPEVKS